MNKRITNILKKNKTRECKRMNSEVSEPKGKKLLCSLVDMSVSLVRQQQGGQTLPGKSVVF